MSDLLGKQVRLKTMQGAVHAEGKVKWYCDAPTVMIETAEGERVYWRADLCEVVKDDLADYLESVRRTLTEKYDLVETRISIGKIEARKLYQPFKKIAHSQ